MLQDIAFFNKSQKINIAYEIPFFNKDDDIYYNTNSFLDNFKIRFKKALNVDVNEIYNPVGCKDCIEGYMGRIAIHEVLSINQEIRDAIVNNFRKDELRKLVYKEDHTISILKDGLQKVLNGDTTFEEIIRLTDIEDDFGDDDIDIKNALLGKASQTTTEENKEDEILDIPKTNPQQNKKDYDVL